MATTRLVVRHGITCMSSYSFYVECCITLRASRSIQEAETYFDERLDPTKQFT